MNGKNILLLSDTHGDVKSLKKIFLWTQEYFQGSETISTVVFLGDGISDLSPAASATGFFADWKIVSGNNDFNHSLPGNSVFDFSGNRFFICHGHRHNLYSGFYPLIAAARSSSANVVLFGHTHVPFYKKEEGILLINPGSIGSPRSKLGKTFAIIECVSNEPLKVDFWIVCEKTGIKKAGKL